MDGFQLAAALAATLLSGGLLGVWLRFLIQRRKLSADERVALRAEGRADFEMVLALVTKQRDEAYATIREHESRFELLELEIQGLRLANDFDPFPNWIVDLQGRYIFVNREFEKQFLDQRGMIYRDLIGKRHEDFWPDEFCRKLRFLDGEARRRADGRARATVLLEGKQVTVHKFPVRVKGIPVAFAGYITQVEDMLPERAVPTT